MILLIFYCIEILDKKQNTVRVNNAKSTLKKKDNEDWIIVSVRKMNLNIEIVKRDKENCQKNIGLKKPLEKSQS